MLYGIIGLVIGCVAGFLLGIWYRKSKAKEAEAKIANADEEALRIVNDAIKSAETKKKEMLLEAKEEILRSRSEYEKEEKSRRADLQRHMPELPDSVPPDFSIDVFRANITGTSGEIKNILENTTKSGILDWKRVHCICMVSGKTEAKEQGVCP